MKFGTYWSLCFFNILLRFLIGTDAREAVIGGYLVYRIDGMPYVISVQYPMDNHACGGGFIRDKFVLTAARCVIDHNGEFIPGALFVRAKSIFLHSNNADYVLIKVIRIYVPSAYNAKSYVADIAVLELSRGLRGSNSKTYWLDLSQEQSQNLVGRTVIVAGFGWNEVRPSRRGGVIGNSDGLLRYGQGYVSTMHKCEESYPHGMINSDVHVCAQLTWGAPCTGDTGGLLVRNHRDSRKNRTVVGILIKSTARCNESHSPGLYTRVSHYRQFIDDAIAGRNSSTSHVYNVPFL